MTVLNHDGKKIMSAKLDNDPNELLRFVRQFESPKEFAIETNYNWPVYYDSLNSEVDEFHLLRAKKLKAIIQSQSKCDKKDADEIAHLTCRATDEIIAKCSVNERTRIELYGSL